ncbi:uncharacterized protein LOC122257078 isoform X2 [Penaeus japonicus]|uniref:uncharacterized protein LOC122257078 isoform X2 n=1 Tax=Penaeus japonicus TaxID=27405 RepID=UPI001C70E2BD|nr:uncharacterized protein LOC122257078 isoform X2 [Penaeus japonicus]
MGRRRACLVWLVIRTWAWWVIMCGRAGADSSPFPGRPTLATPPAAAAAAAVVAKLQTSTTAEAAANNNVRTNVVAEVPGIDVGPLVAVTVALGDTARLPCRHPQPRNDTLNLVLWYLNHTSRPFLSYDARAGKDHRFPTLFNGAEGGGQGAEDLASSRMRLEEGGTALVVEDVHKEDVAEYRCRVHFRLSPTWTQRLLLTVPELVSGLVLVDLSGQVVTGGRVGPLSEGDLLTLTCKALHGTAKVESLKWILGGVQVDSTWRRVDEGTATNVLDLGGLDQRHHNARLTCRLTTSDPAHAHVLANITDVSTVITMFHVPEATIVVDGGREDEGGHEVTEGDGVTFKCTVSADPPAYNITWLHNGRVVTAGGRRWQPDNTTLSVTPVTKDDAGLYTCLASNSEGDGHSNAVLLRVAHRPQCSERTERHLVVATNTSVTLSCQMESLPENVTFTWTMAPSLLDPAHEKDMVGVRGGVITGDAPPPHHPGLIDLTPGHPPPSDPARPWLTPASPRPWDPDGRGGGWEASGEDLVGEGNVLLKHRVDPSSPTRSTVTFKPSAPVQVFCYARNRVGRTRVPCSYTLTLVDPPQPLKKCNVTLAAQTRLEVRCEDDMKAPEGNKQRQDTPQVHHSPGISFVRSSEVRTSANLEVWSSGTLLANVSEDRPVFTVEGLPPASTLELAMYAVTPHARSTPLFLHARTLPRPTVRPVEISTKAPGSDDDDFLAEEEGLWMGVGGAVGGLAGGLGVLLLLGTLLVVAIQSRQRRRGDLGGDDPLPQRPLDALSVASSAPLESHTPMDTRPSVYCVGSSGEAGETPWLETSITPLVAPNALLTPPTPQAPSVIAEDVAPSEVN